MTIEVILAVLAISGLFSTPFIAGTAIHDGGGSAEMLQTHFNFNPPSTSSLTKENIMGSISFLKMAKKIVKEIPPVVEPKGINFDLSQEAKNITSYMQRHANSLDDPAYKTWQHAATIRQSITNKVAEIWNVSALPRSRNFLSRAADAFEIAQEKFDIETRSLNVDPNDSDFTDTVSLLLKDRARIQIEMEEVTVKAPKEIRALMIGVLGDPQLSIPAKVHLLNIIILNSIITTITLIIEFTMNFDLMRTGTSKFTAIGAAVALSLIMTLSVYFASNRMRALLTNLSAKAAFKRINTNNQDSFRDQEVGHDVYVFPTEPLFWFQFWIAHGMFLGFMAMIVSIRVAIIRSQDSGTWASGTGTIIMFFFLLAFYIFESFMRSEIVHPRMNDLRQAHERLEEARATLIQIDRGQDADTLKINELVNARRTARTAQVEILHRLETDVSSARRRVQRLWVEYLELRDRILTMHWNCVRSFSETVNKIDPQLLVDNNPSRMELDSALNGLLSEISGHDRYLNIIEYSKPEIMNLNDGLNANELIQTLWPKIRADAWNASQRAELAANRRDDLQIRAIQG